MWYKDQAARLRASSCRHSSVRPLKHCYLPRGGGSIITQDHLPREGWLATSGAPTASPVTLLHPVVFFSSTESPERVAQARARPQLQRAGRLRQGCRGCGKGKASPHTGHERIGSQLVLLKAATSQGQLWRPPRLKKLMKQPCGQRHLTHCLCGPLLDAPEAKARLSSLRAGHAAASYCVAGLRAPGRSPPSALLTHRPVSQPALEKSWYFSLAGSLNVHLGLLLSVYKQTQLQIQVAAEGSHHWGREPRVGLWPDLLSSTATPVPWQKRPVIGSSFWLVTSSWLSFFQMKMTFILFWLLTVL